MDLNKLENLNIFYLQICAFLLSIDIFKKKFKLNHNNLTKTNKAKKYKIKLMLHLNKRFHMIQSKR